MTSKRKQETVTCDLIALERDGCSRMGNPRHRVVTSVGSFLTAADCSVAYGLPNLFGYDRVGTLAHSRQGVTLHLNGWGKVTGVQLADGSWV
jgi:hypothetical protein